MAKKNKIDINKVQATGKGGRVTKTDLINYMEGKTKPLGATGKVVAAVAPVQPALTGTT